MNWTPPPQNRSTQRLALVVVLDLIAQNTLPLLFAAKGTLRQVPARGSTVHIIIDGARRGRHVHAPYRRQTTYLGTSEPFYVSACVLKSECGLGATCCLDLQMQASVPYRYNIAHRGQYARLHGRQSAATARYLPQPGGRPGSNRAHSNAHGRGSSRPRAWRTRRARLRAGGHRRYNSKQ
jgi:hypothetical protein